LQHLRDDLFRSLFDPACHKDGQQEFFKAISGCILPMIAPMAAGGIIKGVLTILTTFGVLTSDNGIYLILYAAADALMYFMPIIVGFSAGKVFGRGRKCGSPTCSRWAAEH